MWLVPAICLGAALVLSWTYSRRRLRYWSSRGVPSPPAVAFLGHVHRMFNRRKGRWLFENEVYYKYGGSRFAGVYEFHRPILIVGDPELMKSILVKDFDHFTDRRIQVTMSTERDRVMNYMLTSKRGEDWRALRSVMTPTFTSGKMKSMFPLVCDKADELVSFCLKESSQKNAVDMKCTFGRFTIDTLASCAFGIECNSFASDGKAEFPQNVDRFFKITTGRLLKFFLYRISPRLFNLLKLKFNPPELDFFREVVTHTIAERKQSKRRRNDFLDLLLDASKPEVEGEQDIAEHHHPVGEPWPTPKASLDDHTIAAQSLLFLVAGYDTSASTLAFASFLLAKHTEEQNRLRQEIKELLDDSEGLTYTAIMEAKFLDACLMETLRLYPPGPRLQRTCTKSYKIPGTDLTLPEGSTVQCLVWSVHHDPKYWNEPEKFYPDRFLPENKANIKSFTHMPFGMGPRSCIGMRFALMEVKVALAKILLAFDLQLAPGLKDLVLEGGNSSVLRPKHGVNLVLTPLKRD